ncbi:GGDEF domain-containing protein [Permianibacter sp. IMCC34836]|uniref:GGDEF domain-containing protein n=1 Tax=Permianibacter fluminis TaxID=2738515 RepID=UPI001553C46F|nr:GGDEF domain-containing protein [Permianibacter fluminis]NQD36349.1 GGDEF domain-containing protein [Permianibacter fluminis]
MLDTRTMIVMLVFSTLVSSLLMWLTQRRQQAGQGILTWALSYVAFSLAFLLMAMRASTPSTVSVVLPNLLIFLAVGLMTEAVRQALELPLRVRWTMATIVGSVMLIFILVALIGSDYQQRVNAISVLMLPLGAYPGWILLRGCEHDEPARRFLGITFLTIALLMLIRLLTGLSGVHVSQGLHDVSWVHSVFYLAVFVIFYAMGIGFMLMARERLMRDLARRATTDALTGAYNRHAFEPIASTALAQIDRHQLPVSLLMLDLDHFKTVNDRHGHLAGDYVLKTITEIIRQELRAGDVLARYGGEELSVLLPGSDTAAAKRIAERIRHMVETTVLDWHKQSIRLTVSVGMATAVQREHLLDLIAAADAALYAAKAAGRNQVEQRPIQRAVAVTAAT